jgi:eukaryotic-like serine/threonine-protein kinase
VSSARCLDAPSVFRAPRTRRGPYQFYNLLGEGGAAEVFAAIDEGSPDAPTVAVKIALPAYRRTASHLAMLEREARLMAPLSHPNVVKLFDAGMQDGNYVLVMEHVQGSSMARLMNSLERRCESMPRPIALYIALAVLDALEYLHHLPHDMGIGIVHRDISPGNILIDCRGRVVLIDFGIAHPCGTVDPTRGRLRGKVGYLSPEQARGVEVDARSDLFSFAVMLAEMLLHCRFFPGSNPLETLKLILRGDLGTLDRARDRLPLELRGILAMALDPAPEQRFQSAREFALALRDFARHQSILLPERDDVISWLERHQITVHDSGTFQLAPGPRKTRPPPLRKPQTAAG